MDRRSLGKELALLRQERGLSLRQVEAMCGVSYQYISAMENGAPNANVTLDTLTSILTALNGDLQVVRDRKDRSLAEVLFDEAVALSAADLLRLTRIARALPKLKARTAEVLTASFEGAAEDAE